MGSYKESESGVYAARLVKLAVFRSLPGLS